jgi:hypothetical protein
MSWTAGVLSGTPWFACRGRRSADHSAGRRYCHRGCARPADRNGGRGYDGNGSLGLLACLRTSWRDGHLPGPGAWYDIAAWRGSRFAGRSNQNSDGRHRTHIVWREPADVRRIAARTCNGWHSVVFRRRRFASAGVSWHGRFDARDLFQYWNVDGRQRRLDHNIRWRRHIRKRLRHLRGNCRRSVGWICSSFDGNNGVNVVG